jgi:ATP-dependent Lhr-like helicase
VVLRSGTPLVWFDRRSHHLVTFPESAHDVSWADALVELVKDGRARSVEVRKVDGEPVGDALAAVLRAAGFVDGYRGLAFQSTSTSR